jgi:hypothetical protein
VHQELKAAQMTDTMEDRCRAFIKKQSNNRMLRQGDPLADLIAFVCAENGRKADPRLDKSLPLVLYFDNDEDRDEFIQAVLTEKPNWTTRKI